MPNARDVIGADRFNVGNLNRVAKPANSRDFFSQPLENGGFTPDTLARLTTQLQRSIGANNRARQTQLRQASAGGAPEARTALLNSVNNEQGEQLAQALAQLLQGGLNRQFGAAQGLAREEQFDRQVGLQRDQGLQNFLGDIGKVITAMLTKGA